MEINERQKYHQHEIKSDFVSVRQQKSEEDDNRRNKRL